MCLGSCWCKSVMAWGSAGGVTQRFHPLRPEDSISLAPQSALTHQAHSGERTKQGGVLISYLCEHQVLVTRLVYLTRLMSEKTGWFASREPLLTSEAPMPPSLFSLSSVQR